MYRNLDITYSVFYSFLKTASSMLCSYAQNITNFIIKFFGNGSFDQKSCEKTKNRRKWSIFSNNKHYNIYRQKFNKNSKISFVPLLNIINQVLSIMYKNQLNKIYYILSGCS